MAFQDITKVMYDGQIKIDYKDKAHRYYARPRINWDLPEDNAKAWGKIIYPKGTTTLLGETLEKKGLMQWPKGLALRTLLGFYDFDSDRTGEDGKAIRMTGFSKGVGSLWELLNEDTAGMSLEQLQEKVLPLALAAAKAWQVKQKKGADIGTVVHDAIEHFIKGQAFDIAEQYLWNIKEATYETEELRDKAIVDMEIDVPMAEQAFLQFQKWWTATAPTLYGAEDLLYMMNVVHQKDTADCEKKDVNGNCHCQDICGTYDGDIGIQAKYHPVFADMDQKIIRVTADWKTSNASSSKEACMPEGIGYDYFVQSAIYEMMRRQMGMPAADDLLIVSCRKDGGFTLLYASELGLTVGDCIEWAKSVINCFRFRDKARAGIAEHALPKINNQVEAF